MTEVLNYSIDLSFSNSMWSSTKEREVSTKRRGNKYVSDIPCWLLILWQAKNAEHGDKDRPSHKKYFTAKKYRLAKYSMFNVYIYLNWTYCFQKLVAYYVTKYPLFSQRIGKSRIFLGIRSYFFFNMKYHNLIHWTFIKCTLCTEDLNFSNVHS